MIKDSFEVIPFEHAIEIFILIQCKSHSVGRIQNLNQIFTEFLIILLIYNIFIWLILQFIHRITQLSKLWDQHLQMNIC